jgi:phenylalanyl-tRNA synthetase alpha chain
LLFCKNQGGTAEELLPSSLLSWGGGFFAPCADFTIFVKIKKGTVLMKEKLEAIRKAAQDELATVNLPAELENIRVKYLGKKGELTAILKQMGGLPAEERPVVGGIANEVRVFIEEHISTRGAQLRELETAAKLESEKIDVTMPGKRHEIGRRHPLSIVLNELKDIFTGMGFSIAQGPEIEFVTNNFDALNTPQNHPARDPQDTFYIDENILLRTQTSPVQIRVMKSQKPPIRIIAPGRVYRSDAIDGTHPPLFHQIEGLVVDRGITMADLKGTLDAFAKALYGSDSVLRFRPHHFPFTEPSCEMDTMCFVCQGKGCRLCKGEGWIELLGAGMVHPNVLRNCGIDPEEYSGFAFGMGLERLVMRRFGIDDMRLLYENDLRFLSQF